MIDDKSLDRWEGFIGKRGTGKSTGAVARAIDIAHEVGGAYIIAQDPQRRIPESWPDGTKIDICRHEHLQSLAAGLTTRPGAVHCVASGRAVPVVEYAKQVTAESLRTGNGKLTPVVVILDEAVNIEGSSPHYLSDAMRDLVAGCRHYNVAMVWTSQQPQFLHNSFLSLSTQLYLYRITDERALKNLSLAGVPDSILRQLPTLEKGKRFTFSDL